MGEKSARVRKPNKQRQRSNNRPGFFQFSAESWDHARTIGKQMILWAFRGQSDANWGLTTTIERATEYFGNWPDLPPSIRAGREQLILYDFQRRAHHYITSPPSDGDLVEWLALIQHHGGPTRLLDFTHSFYVAAFFALERAVTDAAVWCINLDRLEDAISAKVESGNVEDETIYDINRRHISIAHQFLEAGSPQSLVLNLEPERMNERLTVQQGLFLFPCDLSLPFDQNLAATFDTDRESIFDDSRFWDEVDYDAGINLDEVAVVKNYHPTAVPFRGAERFGKYECYRSKPVSGA